MHRSDARDVCLGSNPDFLLGGRRSASAECRHWSGRAVRWSSCAILLSGKVLPDPTSRSQLHAVAPAEAAELRSVYRVLNLREFFFFFFFFFFTVPPGFWLVAPGQPTAQVAGRNSAAPAAGPQLAGAASSRLSPPRHGAGGQHEPSGPPDLSANNVRKPTTALRRGVGSRGSHPWAAQPDRPAFLLTRGGLPLLAPVISKRMPIWLPFFCASTKRLQIAIFYFLAEVRG